MGGPWVSSWQWPGCGVGGVWNVTWGAKLAGRLGVSQAWTGRIQSGIHHGILVGKAVGIAAYWWG